MRCNAFEGTPEEAMTKLKSVIEKDSDLSAKIAALGGKKSSDPGIEVLADEDVRVDAE